MAAAHGYSELRDEVESALRWGVDAYRVECLRPVGTHPDLEDASHQPPFYEEHGERQVAAGYYTRVLRRRQHLVPLRDALREHVDRCERCQER
jgi:hypothetical protein